MTLESYVTYSANQMYKKYKSEGGTLNFTDWINREKTKGVYPMNVKVQEEVNSVISAQSDVTNENNKKSKEGSMKSTTLGFPTSTLIIASVVIVGAFIYSKYYKNK